MQQSLSWANELKNKDTETEGFRETFDIFRVKSYLNSVFEVEDTEQTSERETLHSIPSTTKISKQMNTDET